MSATKTIRTNFRTLEDAEAEVQRMHPAEFVSGHIVPSEDIKFRVDVYPTVIAAYTDTQKIVTYKFVRRGA